MKIEEKLVLSNGRFLIRKIRYKQFYAILLHITKKFEYNFIVKICRTSFNLLAIVHALLTSCWPCSSWGKQEEFPDHQQNICNPQFCFLRPMEVLMAHKIQNSKLDLPSPRWLQVFEGHYRLEKYVLFRKPFCASSKNCFVAITYRHQHGE